MDDDDDDDDDEFKSKYDCISLLLPPWQRLLAAYHVKLVDTNYYVIIDIHAARIMDKPTLYSICVVTILRSVKHGNQTNMLCYIMVLCSVSRPAYWPARLRPSSISDEHGHNVE